MVIYKYCQTKQRGTKFIYLYYKTNNEMFLYIILSCLKILRKIYGPTQNPDGTWRIKTNDELRHRMKQEDIIKFMKSQRLRWAAHVMRMENTRTTRKLTEWTPYKTRPAGRPRLRWMDQV